MACAKCGHTKSSPCACKDHGLTTPCNYTNCTTSVCEQIYCYECVQDCTPNLDRKFKTVWDAENVDVTITPLTSTKGMIVEQNDTMREMMQRTALMAMANSSTEKAAIQRCSIAPFYTSGVTQTSVRLNWDKVPSTLTSISIYQALENDLAYTLLTTLTTGLSNTFFYDVTGLTAGQGYKFKLITTDGTVSAPSVSVYQLTLS